MLSPFVRAGHAGKVQEFDRMVKRMLVDATHPEETRVVVVNGTKLEEFDFETSTKKQLKGNIYLAKVIRIEPSLQAAFVEYGGNRHGFLAFSEIHPDYYQIPVADREAILAEQERRARQAEENEGQERPQRRRGRHDRGRGRGGDRSRRNAQPAGDQPAAPGEADAIDAVVQPEQAALDDQPMVQNWDHEAAQAGNYRQNENNETPAAEDASRETDQAEPADGEEDFEERETLNPNGDFRDSEPGWSEASEDRPATSDEPDRDEAEEDGDNSGDDSEPARSYAAERQDWPATYAEAPEEPGNDSQPTDTAGDVSQASNAGEYGETSPAPADGQDSPSNDAPNGDAGEPVPSDLGGVEAVSTVETLGGEDLGEEERPRRAQSLRNYKIQEVIKRRQILLVQVVKEERGNKGAALTTYLSLAGRYCVLMPNAGRGGGISRKITNAADRKRMRDMLSELEVPQGMGVILRTAGLERSNPEIKRDYDYLIRLWDNIREITLKSTAPALIYEEGNLIKRSIRDLYGKDIEDLLIEGEDAYNNARDFMRQLMPASAKKIQLYRDPIPLFHRYQVETQLDAMHSPVVQLKSGAYIVINPTEALVAIDVNSGRATKERNIEETALRTNVEAAEEIARQLRLRDLAGLIVIDFIDMEDQRHQVQVERRMKEAMRSDRARIQIGRISAFGLLELSRQRLRPSLLETSTEVCPHCEGSGRIRSTESTALHVLRAIEEEGIRRRAAEIRVTVPTHVALYLLNQKRAILAEFEMRYGFRVLVDGDDRLIPPNFNLERSRTRPADAMAHLPALASAAYDEPDAIEDDLVEETEAADETGEPVQTGEATDENGGRRRRRRRRRRPGSENGLDSANGDATETERATSDGESGESMPAAESSDEDSDEEAPQSIQGEGDVREDGDAVGEDGQRRRRRGRRGGRRRRQGEPRGNGEAVTQSEFGREADAAEAATDASPDDRQNGDIPDRAAHESVEPAHRYDEPAPQLEPTLPEASDSAAPQPAAEVLPVEPPEPAGPPRRGWWTRLTSGN